MLRNAIIIATCMLLLAAAPIAEAKGKADAPGQVKKAGPAVAAPADTSAVVELAAGSPAWGPSAPASSARDGLREPARVLAFDVGSGAIPTLPPLQQATMTAAVVAPGADGIPTWTWLLPALGLVSVGATVLAVRATRREPSRGSAPQPRLRFDFASPDVASLLRAGKRALERDAVDEAIAWFTQALKLNPRLAVAHFSRGVCLASLGRHEEAYKALRKAHELDAAEGAYRFELSRASARVGRHKEAIALLAPLLALVPGLEDDVAQDEAYVSLRDHPRFLALIGKL